MVLPVADTPRSPIPMRDHNPRPDAQPATPAGDGDHLTPPQPVDSTASTSLAQAAERTRYESVGNLFAAARVDQRLLQQADSEHLLQTANALLDDHTIALAARLSIARAATLHVLESPFVHDLTSQRQLTSACLGLLDGDGIESDQKASLLGNIGLASHVQKVPTNGLPQEKVRRICLPQDQARRFCSHALALVVDPTVSESKKLRIELILASAIFKNQLRLSTQHASLFLIRTSIKTFNDAEVHVGSKVLLMNKLLKAMNTYSIRPAAVELLMLEKQASILAALPDHVLPQKNKLDLEIEIAKLIGRFPLTHNPEFQTQRKQRFFNRNVARFTNLKTMSAEHGTLAQTLTHDASGGEIRLDEEQALGLKKIVTDYCAQPFLPNFKRIISHNALIAKETCAVPFTDDEQQILQALAKPQEGDTGQ